MKIGSLVECTSQFDEIEDFEETPKVGKIYTVSSICKGRWKYITLHEIKNPITEYESGGVGEAEFDIRGFKEVLPPLQNIEEHIKENILELQPK